jgi:hypothetical protein
MNTIQVAQFIENSTVAICAIENGETYSTGSGVIIDNNGTVLTADHVITNNRTLRPEEIDNGEVVILCKNKASEYQQYIPIVWSIAMEAEYLKNPIKIDLALLKPLSSYSPNEFIPILFENPKLGEEIMIGGFPEDICLPFNFDKVVKLTSIAGFCNTDQIKKRLELFNRMLVVKRAIVSKVFPFSFSGFGKSINGSLFYFDNVMHSGGSGGPVVNEKGQLIGIISERAVVDMKYEDSVQGKIPSGAGLAISCQPIFQYYANNKKA